MNKKEKDAIFASRIPGILHYHQTMLTDGVRNKLLYEAIQTHITEQTNFLDVGAGTGVWAILAAKLGAKRVVAIEIEEALIPIIYKHAQENGVAHKIEIIHGNSDDVKIRGKFDVIVSELFGGGAFSETTTNSFISLRKRFLAPGGILIPQKLMMYAVPVHVENSIQKIPAEVPISCNYLQSLKLNYSQNFSLSDREKIKFLAEPKKVLEVDFRTIDSKNSLANLNAVWKLENISEVNAFATFTRSVFTDQIEMDAFGSQSWGAVVYEIKPFPAKSGEIRFSLSLEEQKQMWTANLASETGNQTQNYSPLFTPTRIRMTQKTTPHRKVKPTKHESHKHPKKRA
jgi:predicted RNA methylase